MQLSSGWGVSLSIVLNLNECSNWSNSCLERDDDDITLEISSNIATTPSPVLQDVLNVPLTMPHCSLHKTRGKDIFISGSLDGTIDLSQDMNLPKAFDVFTGD